jgi:hypothetical protein
LIDADRGGHGCSFEVRGGEGPLKLRLAGGRDFDRAANLEPGLEWLI